MALVSARPGGPFLDGADVTGPAAPSPKTWRVLERAFRAGKAMDGFRVIEFSVLGEHMHLIVEARDRVRLARGVQGLAIRIAKALNRFWRRRIGRVFAERYFARGLVKNMEIWRALRYVLRNARKHGLWFSKDQPDPYSSGRWYLRWHQRDRIHRPLRSPPVALPHAHFLSMSCLGLSLDDLPGPRRYEEDEGFTALAVS